MGGASMAGVRVLEVGQRKARNRKYVWERRYICADCVANIFHEMIPQE